MHETVENRVGQRRVADDFMPLEVAPDLADGLTLAIHIVTCALRSHSRARRVRLSADAPYAPETGRRKWSALEPDRFSAVASLRPDGR